MSEYILKVRQYRICNGKEAKLFYFSKWLIPHVRAQPDTLRGYQAFYSRYNEFIEMKITLHLMTNTKETLCVLVTFLKNDNSVFDIPVVSMESQVLYSFIIKVRMDTPIFLFSYLLLIALYTYSTYIIWLKKKIFCSIFFSKSLTRD